MSKIKRNNSNMHKKKKTKFNKMSLKNILNDTDLDLEMKLSFQSTQNDKKSHEIMDLFVISRLCKQPQPNNEYCFIYV